MLVFIPVALINSLLNACYALLLVSDKFNMAVKGLRAIVAGVWPIKRVTYSVKDKNCGRIFKISMYTTKSLWKENYNKENLRNFFVLT